MLVILTPYFVKTYPLGYVWIRPPNEDRMFIRTWVYARTVDVRTVNSFVSVE